MKKKVRTTEELLKIYKRRFFIVLSVLVLFIALTSFYIYLNFDYLAFKHLIAQNYIYTETLDKLYSKELKIDAKGNYYTYFDDYVISVVTRNIREANNDKYTYLYTPKQFEKYQSDEKAEANKSEINILQNDTVYLHITNFSKYTEKFVFDNVSMMKKYPYIIIDLRDNRGGDVDAMNNISGLFLPKGSIISTDRLRITDWVYKAKKTQVLNFKKIIILQNKYSASSSECLIGALKDNLSNVTLIGETTFGKGIGQYTMSLTKGFAVKATILKWFTPKGINIHGKGFDPDIPYSEDDILDFALTKIRLF